MHGILSNMMDSDYIKTYPLFSELSNMLHKLPNGNMLYLSGNLTPYQARKRTEDYKRWEQEHREELEVSSQQLFDDMFGG